MAIDTSERHLGISVSATCEARHAYRVHYIIERDSQLVRNKSLDEETAPMKKALVGPSLIGFLSGYSDALQVVEKITGERGAELENILYASAFQAGVEKFLVPNFKNLSVHDSQFLAKHSNFIPEKESAYHYRLVDSAFSAYLPDGWHNDDRFSVAWSLFAFVADLLDAMSANASLLSARGVPDIAEARELLPSELSVPLENLLISVTEFQTPSLVPVKVIAKSNVKKFSEIISSDLFSRYAAAQETLDDAKKSVTSTLPSVAQSARTLFARNKSLLRLKSSSLSVIEITPKIIDLVFGKLPGGIAEVFAKIGFKYLESNNRVVIYDFGPSIREVFSANLIRMIKDADAKQNPGKVDLSES